MLSTHSASYVGELHEPEALLTQPLLHLHSTAQHSTAQHSTAQHSTATTVTRVQAMSSTSTQLIG